MAVRIVVSGATGRMGAQLGRLVQEAEDLTLAGGIARDAMAKDSPYPGVVPAEEAGPLLAGCDVLVDFSAPEHICTILETHADALAGRAIVIGTTGIDDEDARRAIEQACARSAVLVAANFSVGVNLLLDLARRAARALGDDEFDVEVVETHHRHKADAPSGTALALGRAIAAGRGAELEQMRRDGRSGVSGERARGEIGFHSLRGGEVVGEHEVAFIGGNERITLGHVATDRVLFAEGAVHAARWLAGREPGAYTMRDVLGLSE